MAEPTPSISEREFSIRSVSFSSGQANFSSSAFRPKAIGFSSNVRFLAPWFSNEVRAAVLIDSRSVWGEDGIILAITATIDMGASE